MPKDSSSWARRVTGIGGLVAGIGMALVIAWNLLMGPGVEVMGVDGFLALGSAVFLVALIGSIAVLVGYGWGRRLSRPLWARGVVPLLLGIGIGWGWHLLNRSVDPWGLNQLTDVAPSDPRVVGASISIIAVPLLATVLVLVGAVRVLRSSDPSNSEPAPDQIEQASQDA